MRRGAPPPPPTPRARRGKASSSPRPRPRRARRGGGNVPCSELDGLACVYFMGLIGLRVFLAHMLNTQVCWAQRKEEPHPPVHHPTTRAVSIKKTKEKTTRAVRGSNGTEDEETTQAGVPRGSIHRTHLIVLYLDNIFLIFLFVSEQFLSLNIFWNVFICSRTYLL